MPNTIWSVKKKIMRCSLKVVGETLERGCVFPASFNIITIRKRKGRFSVSVSSVGTALCMYLVPKGCATRALLGGAPGNTPSSQSCQSSDFSDARRRQRRHPTISEETQSQAFEKARHPDNASAAQPKAEQWKQGHSLLCPPCIGSGRGCAK